MMVFGDPSQDVLCAGKRDIHTAAIRDNGVVFIVDAFFDLILSDNSRPVIRHSSGFDQDIRIRQFLLDGFKHVRGGNNISLTDKRSRRKGDRSGYKSDVGTAQHGLMGDGISHFSGAVIGEVADRVESLLGGAGCHNDLFALHGLVQIGDLPFDPLAEDFRLGKLAAARIAAGKITARGINDRKAVFSQDLDIIPGDRIFQHRGVHRRRDELFAFGGKDDRGQHIVSNTVRHLCDDICRGRCDQNNIRLLGDRNMADIKLKFTVKSIDHAL